MESEKMRDMAFDAISFWAEDKICCDIYDHCRNGIEMDNAKDIIKDCMKVAWIMGRAEGQEESQKGGIIRTFEAI